MKIEYTCEDCGEGFKAEDFAEIQNSLSKIVKEEVKSGFEQIVEKCKTIGDLQKLDQKVKELNAEI